MAMPIQSPAAMKVLRLLKTQGALTAAALARALKVTPMAVRQHLYQLEADALVAHHDEARGVGRPTRLWALTDAALPLFPDNHSELALSMISAARATFGEEGLAKLIRERTRGAERAYREKMTRAGASLQRRVKALARIRSEEGYMAECIRVKDGAVMLVENHCPICAAAEACTGICEGELDLFRSLLGNAVAVEREEHIIAGARRCAYRIAPKR